MKKQVEMAVAAVALVLMDKEVIKSNQDAIRGNLLNLDKSIHDNAVQCMLHAEKHGDTSLMRRLLVEIVDAKTGYRRQGLINWMRKFSPMELKGDTINLSGTDGQGNKRTFQVELANQTPFWTDKDNAEKVAKPVFQDTLLSPINRAIKQINEAMENTLNGQPVDKSKPFFDGLYGDKVVDFAAKVQELAAALPKDATLEVRRTQARIASDIEFVAAHTKGDEQEAARKAG